MDISKETETIIEEAIIKIIKSINPELVKAESVNPEQVNPEQVNPEQVNLESDKAEKPKKMILIILSILSILSVVVLYIGMIFNFGSVFTKVCPFVSLLLLICTFILLIFYTHKVKEYNVYSCGISRNFYDFDLEYKIYRCITRNKENRLYKKLNKEYGVPQTYTQWKDRLEKTYPKLVNDEDFYHFLKNDLRWHNNNIQGLIGITLPIEVILVSAWVTVFKEAWEIAILSLLLVLAILCVGAYAYGQYKNKFEYIADVIGALCPKCKEKDRSDL